MTRVYIAAKTVFALIISVWCVRVGHSSRAQCTENVHPLVLSVFFTFFSSRMQDHGVREAFFFVSRSMGGRA